MLLVIILRREAMCVWVFVTFVLSDVNVACTCLHVRSLLWQDNMAIRKNGQTALVMADPNGDARVEGLAIESCADVNLR